MILQNLPLEILQAIFAFLEAKDVLKLYITSKNLASRVPFTLWQHIHIDLFTRPQTWDRHCDHHGHGDHERAINRIISDHDYWRVSGADLPRLCKTQAARNILPNVKKLTLSVTFDEPVPLRNSSNGHGVVLMYSFAFLELFVRVLLPLYRPSLQKIQIKAAISEKTQNPPVDELLATFPSAEKHIWLYSQGFGGLVNMKMTQVTNVKHFGTCFTTSIRDHTYRLLYEYIGPHLPHSTEVLVLCGDVMPVRDYQQLITHCNNLKSLVLLTFDKPDADPEFTSLPQTVVHFALDGDFCITRAGLLNSKLDVSRLRSYEVAAYGHHFHLSFKNLTSLTVSFNPAPHSLNGQQQEEEHSEGQLTTTSGVVSYLASSLRNNIVLEEFRSCGLSMQSLAQFLSRTPAMGQLKRLVMVQTREFYREKLVISPWIVQELFSHCGDLELLILEGLEQPDFSVLQRDGALAAIRDLCPHLEECFLTTGDSEAADMNDTGCPLVAVPAYDYVANDSWVRLREPEDHKYVYRVVTWG